MDGVSIRVTWMLFFIIALCLVSYTSSVSTSRYDPRKESLSRQRHTNQAASLVFGARNQTLSIESSPLSPLIHNAYLQIQAAVQKSYSIQVGNTNDGNANSNACSATALRSTCNLRSAWALCMSLIQAVTCPASASQAVSVTCAIALPSSSSIAFNSCHGGAMSLSALSSWASTCKNTLVTLSISASTANTNITGDGTSTSLLYLAGIPFVRFSMRNVAVMGFGDGSAAFPGAVYLHSLLGAIFGPNVQFGPKNVGYNTSGALVVHSLPSVTVLNSVFVGNSAVAHFDFSTINAYGGALSIFSSNNILILNSTFVNNSVPGGGEGGALYVDASNNVTISGCKWLSNSLTGGGGYGGALYFESSNTITVTNCSIVGNRITGFGGGGALSFWSSNMVTVSNCIIYGNSVTGGGIQGGALDFLSTNTITVTSCSIVGNNITGIGSGGALAFTSSNTINVTSCSILGNSVTGVNGAGGAMIFTSSNTITVASCSIVGNSLTGVNGQGGALYFESSNSITVASCNIVGNSNTGGSTRGGALYFLSSVQISIALSSFTSNLADDGGAIYIDTKSSFIGMTGVHFSQNVALTGAGGAVYVGDSCSYISFGGPLPLLETCVGVCDQALVLSNNNIYVADSSTNVQEPTSMHVVGYLVIFNDVPTNTVGEAIVGDYIYSSTFKSANIAPGVNGEAPYMYLGSTMTVNITRVSLSAVAQIKVWVFPFSISISVFDRNVATIHGGAIYIGNSVNNMFVMPGTVFTDNSVTGLASLSNNIYFYSTIFQGNNASVNGGAVAFQKLVTSVHFYDCSFVSNSAQYGGGVYLDTDNGNDLTDTGLIQVIDFVNVTMCHNQAALDGGGIYANNLNVFSLVSARLVNNVAGGSGGAIAMNTINTMSISASNTITSLITSTVSFTHNTCKGRGGALAMNTGSIVTINGTTIFDSNYAQHEGGAIAVSASSLTLGPSAITFINNSALSGSAMYLTSSSTSSVDILVPLGSGCASQASCTTPPGYISRGYITRAFYGQDSSTGCNTAPLDLYIHELGVCTTSFTNQNIGPSSFGVYSLILSSTGGFSQLLFEKYGSTTSGMKNKNDF